MTTDELTISVRMRWWVKPLLAVTPSVVRLMPWSGPVKARAVWTVVRFAAHRGLVVK